MTSVSSGVSSLGGWSGMPPPPRMQGSQSQSGVSAQEMFSKLDGDGDGSISQAELAQGLKSSGGGQGAASCQGSGQGGQGGQNGFGGMGMNTQGFASMMGGGMQPPPPPGGDQGGGMSLGNLDSDQDGAITMAEFGLTDASSESAASDSDVSTQQAQKELFNMIDSDQSGDLSKSEVSGFEDKMKALFEKMQQIGMQEVAGASTSDDVNRGISLTA